jgi:WD40 repeat protein
VIELKNGNIISGSDDNKIKIWNISRNESLATFTEHTGYVYRLLELRNGDFVSGSGDGTIKIWHKKKI